MFDITHCFHWERLKFSNRWPYSLGVFVARDNKRTLKSNTLAIGSSTKKINWFLISDWTHEICFFVVFFSSFFSWGLKKKTFWLCCLSMILCFHYFYEVDFSSLSIRNVVHRTDNDFLGKTEFLKTLGQNEHSFDKNKIFSSLYTLHRLHRNNHRTPCFTCTSHKWCVWCVCSERWNKAIWRSRTFFFFACERFS